MENTSCLALMQLHVQAAYTHDRRLRIEAINDWAGGVAPRFWLGRTAQGAVWRFRADLPDALCRELEQMCRREPACAVHPCTSAQEHAYCKLLDAHAPIKRIGVGPTYWFAAPPRSPQSARLPTRVTEENASCLRGGLEAWIPDVPYQQPFVVALNNGQAVAVCASVRITAQAHVAGVETLSAYRRNGHAVDVVAGWAQAVMRLGRIALYSTSWDNVASQGVATRLGLQMFGEEFYIM